MDDGVAVTDDCNASLNLDIGGKRFRNSLRAKLFEKRKQIVRTTMSSTVLDEQHFSSRSSSKFFRQLSQRVADKPLNQLVFIEIFSGTGGLCAEVRRLGLHSSVGIDAHISKQVKSPVLRIDLTSEHGQSLLWRMLEQHNVVAVHLGPPCGTSSRARDIRRKSGPDPQPLRSEQHPDGLPHLVGKDLLRVTLANQLYDITARVYEFCCANGILATVENPARSYMWLTDPFANLRKCDRKHSAILHHCMFGSKRKKATKLLANFPQISKLAVQCDGSHAHEPWGRSNGKWATATEVEYPMGLCRSWAALFMDVFLQYGAKPSVTELMQVDAFHSRHSRAMTGKQPRGRRLPPFVAEFKLVCKLTCDNGCIPPPIIQQPWPIPPNATIHPHLESLPPGSKTIGSQTLGDKGERAEITIGIPWEPAEFVQRAAGMGHPKLFLKTIPCEMDDVIHTISSMSPLELGRMRTATARKWILRSQELREKEYEKHSTMEDHCREVLAKKSLMVFDEMVKASDYKDVNIAKDIETGFDLMGHLPSSSVFQKNSSYATLMPEHVRSVSEKTRAAIWNSTRACIDKEIAEAVYAATVEEVNRGWLRGPYEFNDLPDGASLTRRFGIMQSSSTSDGIQSKKIRPIDDFTESLINLTNSCDEKISIHGVDTIISGIVKRLLLCGGRCESDGLVAKAVDLRKAYKQLAISKGALQDAFLCVLNCETSKPEAFQCRVLPFGARAAVQAFCRASHALWFLGTVIFKLHWSVYFDDFFLIENKAQSRHTGMVVTSFFTMLGWDVSDEKDAGFLTVARALGVCIDLSDSTSGMVSVYNTEARKSEIRDSIDKLLEAGSYKKGELLTLRGRLLFAENQIFGKTCNVAMKVVSSYAEHHLHGAIPSELSTSLKVLRDRVTSGVPCKVGSDERSVMHLYTDACYELGPKAGIGGVLINSDGVCVECFGSWLSESTISSMTIGDRETIILELEAFAILVGIHVFNNRLLGCDTVVFCDNNSVLASFISGKSANPLVSLIANISFQWEERAGVILWHERVPSHSNIADGPSRGHFDGSLGERVDAGRLSEVVNVLLNQCMSGVKGISNS